MTYLDTTLDNATDHTTSQLVYLLHRNKSITQIRVFPRLELRFENLYIASQELNLTGHGFYDYYHDVKTIKLIHTREKSFMQSWLAGHLLIVLIIGALIAWAMYKMISEQTRKLEEESEREFREFMEALERTRAEAHRAMLEREALLKKEVKEEDTEAKEEKFIDTLSAFTYSVKGKKKVVNPIEGRKRLNEAIMEEDKGSKSKEVELTEIQEDKKHRHLKDKEE